MVAIVVNVAVVVAVVPAVATVAMAVAVAGRMAFVHVRCDCKQKKDMYTTCKQSNLLADAVPAPALPAAWIAILQGFDALE